MQAISQRFLQNAKQLPQLAGTRVQVGPERERVNEVESRLTLRELPQEALESVPSGLAIVDFRFTEGREIPQPTK